MLELVCPSSGHCNIGEIVCPSSGHCNIGEIVCPSSGYCNIGEIVCPSSGHCNIGEISLPSNISLSVATGHNCPLTHGTCCDVHLPFAGNKETSDTGSGGFTTAQDPVPLGLDTKMITVLQPMIS